jgi:hypothetical protein
MIGDSEIPAAPEFSFPIENNLGVMLRNLSFRDSIFQNKLKSVGTNQTPILDSKINPDLICAGNNLIG